MDESKSLIDTLKRVLRSKDITYAQISKQLGISEASVKRVFSEKSFTLDRFERVCQIAGLSIADLAQLNKKDTDQAHHVYTNEQEDFFAENPNYLAFFDLLIRFGSLKRVRDYKPHLTDMTISNYLSQLVKLGLIKLGADGEVQFPVSRDVSWQKNGALRRRFLTLAKADFTNDDFAGDLTSFELTGVEITPRSARKIIESLKELAAQIHYISDMESNINAETRNMGIMLCARPWKFTLLEDC